jgi:hypothetical protein
MAGQAAIKQTATSGTTAPPAKTSAPAKAGAQPPVKAAARKRVLVGGTAQSDAWLTTILRPAGELDRLATDRIAGTLSHLAECSDLAVLDLSAAQVASPQGFARRLSEPAAAFERGGRCLLILGASPALTAELDRAAVPAFTMDTAMLPQFASPEQGSLIAS